MITMLNFYVLELWLQTQASTNIPGIVISIHTAVFTTIINITNPNNLIRVNGVKEDGILCELLCGSLLFDGQTTKLGTDSGQDDMHKNCSTATLLDALVNTQGSMENPSEFSKLSMS